MELLYFERTNYSVLSVKNLIGNANFFNYKDEKQEWTFAFALRIIYNRKELNGFNLIGHVADTTR